MATSGPEELLNQLRLHPGLQSAELCTRLGGINRSTLARWLKGLQSEVVSRGGSRRLRYALRRALRGSSEPIPLYRIDQHGQGHEIGHLDLIYPSGSALAYGEVFPWPLIEGMADGWFDGLPYPIYDMRPQGFLGRNFARSLALDLAVSSNPEEWSDDQVVHVLAQRGYDLPGDLILGETAYRRFLNFRQQGADRFLTDEQIRASYPGLAEAALAQGDAGSSAGGEFPKFTAGRLLNGKPVDVIVKFSGADGSPAVERWADLLVCEHLALATLARHLGIPAAESAIHRYGGRTFLEVVRFDRHGEFGRSPVCTLQSINGALLGKIGWPWPRTAAALRKAGWLQDEDTTRIALIWWFGRLIANNDMHEGNLAFRPGLQVAPVYDMLPMLYAPLRGGEVPNREFLPELPLPGEAGIWRQAADAATEFWQACTADSRISPGFREICGRNLQILEQATA